MRETGVTTLDEALVNARGGDEAGFLVLWDALQPRLLRYLRVVGCDDVEDVAGETWLQVVRGPAEVSRRTTQMSSAPGCSPSRGTAPSTPRGPAGGSVTRCWPPSRCRPS